MADLLGNYRLSKNSFLIGEEQEFGFGDGFNLQDFGENCVLYRAVHSDQRYGFRAARRFAPSQCEGRDVYAEASQCVADLADDSGLVVIAQEKNGAAQL